MIRINDKFIQNQVHFPKLFKFNPLHCVIYDGQGNQVFEKDYDDEAQNPNFYVVTVDWSELPDGEYYYFLNNIDSGIIQIGFIEPELKEFEPEKELIQYEG